MPLLFFHIYNTQGAARDEEGMEVASLLEARARAITGIRSLLSSEVVNGEMDLTGRIEIADMAGQVVLTVPFSEAITISRG